DGVGEEFPADLGIFVLTSFSIQSSEFPAVDNAIVLFDGVSGNRVKNGPLVSNFIFGPEISEIGALATYDNTTGTLLANGPTPSAVGVNLIEFPDSASDGYFRKKIDNTLELLTGDQLKTNLSLNNVDNTSDQQKVDSGPISDALDLKSDLESPAFTGNPTAPTPDADDDSESIATTEYVQGELTDRI